MTDNKIIKALECCLADGDTCNNCPLKRECEINPFDATLARYSLDLIKRQQAEIEIFKANIIPRLKKANQACKFLGRENQLLKREITNLRMLLADEGLLEDEE